VDDSHHLLSLKLLLRDNQFQAIFLPKKHQLFNFTSKIIKKRQETSQTILGEVLET
jgi:hypothetical protein